MPIRTLLDELRDVRHLAFDRPQRQLSSNDGRSGAVDGKDQATARIAEYIARLPILRTNPVQPVVKESTSLSASDRAALLVDLLARVTRVLHALGRISDARATALEVDEDGEWVVVYEDAARTGDALRARMVLLCLRDQSASAQSHDVWTRAREVADRFGVLTSVVCVQREDDAWPTWYFARDTDDDQERIGPVYFTSDLPAGRPSLPEILLYLLDTEANLTPAHVTRNTPTSTPIAAAPPPTPMFTFVTSTDAPPLLGPAFSPPPMPSPRKRRRSPPPAIPDSLFSPSPRKKPRLDTHGDMDDTPLFARAPVMRPLPTIEESPLFSRVRPPPPNTKRLGQPIVLATPAGDSPLFARAAHMRLAAEPATPTPVRSGGRSSSKRTRSNTMDSPELVVGALPRKRAKVESVVVIGAGDASPPSSPRRSERRRTRGNQGTTPTTVPPPPARPDPPVLRTRNSNSGVVAPKPAAEDKPARIVRSASRTPVPRHRGQRDEEDEDEPMSHADDTTSDDDDADLPPDSSPVRPARHHHHRGAGAVFPTHTRGRRRTRLRADSPASSIASSPSPSPAPPSPFRSPSRSRSRSRSDSRSRSRFRSSSPEQEQQELPVPNVFGLDDSPVPVRMVGSMALGAGVETRRAGVDLVGVRVPAVRVSKDEDPARLGGRWVDAVACGVRRLLGGIA